MIHYIYAISIIVVIIIFITFYYYKRNIHNEQLRKIDILESLEKKRDEALEKERAKTVPCSTPDLMTPRDCYYGSDFKCSWNINIKRCDVL